VNNQVDLRSSLLTDPELIATGGLLTALKIVRQSQRSPGLTFPAINQDAVRYVVKSSFANAIFL
jgi:hypothetical protein